MNVIEKYDSFMIMSYCTTNDYVPNSSLYIIIKPHNKK